jgi:hypothetical protein
MSSTQPTQTSNATNYNMYFMSRTCMAPPKQVDITSVGSHTTTDKMAPSKSLDITSVGRSHATNDKMYFMSRTCMAPSNAN